jgi:uncharacterized protein (TIGR00297 family)
MGWLARALTRAGAAAATLVGTLILWRTGWPGMAALGAFFLGSSLISRIAPDRSVSRFDAKGSTRDSWQVLANGGAAALACIIPLPPNIPLWIVTASLAAAAADTWATSTGGWSRTDPRHILTHVPVPAGTSGGVTLTGTAGALAGAATVGLGAGWAAGSLVLLPLAIGIGTMGMLLDSVIGSVWQGRFHCPQCDQPTERAHHRCGESTRLIGGIHWLTNDGVNAIATLFAALLGYLAAIVFAPLT